MSEYVLVPRDWLDVMQYYGDSATPVKPPPDLVALREAELRVIAEVEKNISTMQVTVTRLRQYGKAHFELDEAIRNTQSAISALHAARSQMEKIDA